MCIFALNGKGKELRFGKRCNRTYCSWRSSQHSTCSHPRTCQTELCKYTWPHRATSTVAPANDRRRETCTHQPAHLLTAQTHVKHGSHCKNWESTEMCKDGKIRKSLRLISRRKTLLIFYYIYFWCNHFCLSQ